MFDIKKKSKKAESDMLGALTHLVLFALIFVPLSVLLYKLGMIIYPNVDDATLKNFDQLVATIQNMEQGTTVTNYPIYIDSDYAIIGYSAQGNPIGEYCRADSITRIYENKKPEACGAGNGGCICLCQSSSLFEDLCQDNDDVITCYGREQLTEDISFEGETYTNDVWYCDFAYVQGTASPITISLTKGLQSSADTDANAAVTVHICTKDCNTQTTPTTPSSETTLVSAQETATSDFQASMTKSVLILGDSQSMGTYGDELYASFKNAGYTTNKYAVCGATPKYFTSGLAIISSSCNAEYQYDDGTSASATSGNTPLLQDLLVKHTPRIVVGTFASNMYGSSEASIKTDVKTFAQEITSKQIACYWIGPPQGPRYKDLQDYQKFKNTIKESAEENGCIFIDSESYSAFNFCTQTPFGCSADVHFDNNGAAGKAAAKTWADNIYTALELKLVS